MDVGMDVVALKEITVYDVNTFLPVPPVQKGAIGMIYKDARKTLKDGTEVRFICVRFPTVDFPIVINWNDVEGTIKPA